jgi:hypothetical protein
MRWYLLSVETWINHYIGIKEYPSEKKSQIIYPIHHSQKRIPKTLTIMTECGYDFGKGLAMP